MKKGFTLVEIMIVVAILGLLVAIGVPGFLTARNKSQQSVERANLKSISDNIASYCVNENMPSLATLEVVNLWPNSVSMADPESYIRKRLTCPMSDAAYNVDQTNQIGSCSTHGNESVVSTLW